MEVPPGQVTAGDCARDKERPADAAAAAAATACRCFCASSGDSSRPFKRRRGPLGTLVLIGASLRPLPRGPPDAASCPAAAAAAVWPFCSWLLMLLPVLLLRLAGADAAMPPGDAAPAAPCRLLQLPGTGIMIEPWGCAMQWESMPSALAMLHTRLMPKLRTLPERHISWLPLLTCNYATSTARHTHRMGLSKCEQPSTTNTSGFRSAHEGTRYCPKTVLTPAAATYCPALCWLLRRTFHPQCHGKHWNMALPQRA
jgi:hypothetical protein